MIELTLPATIPMIDADGTTAAWLEITPRRALLGQENDALILVDPATATENGETELQLKEAETYEYVVRDAPGLRLRSRLSTRFKRLNDGDVDAGLIETGNFCGTLLLELVNGDEACATTLLDVRSLKVDYRTEYRGMLRDLTDRMVGLIVDAQSSAKVSFRSNFEERRDEGWLQLQLELLRETLESSDFNAAVSRILAYPHERLTPQEEMVRTDRPMRHSASTVRKLIHGSPRRVLPDTHPLRARHGIESVAERITVSRHYQDLDTPENRFVKFALENMRAFLDHAASVFDGAKGWGASAQLANRFSEKLELWLGRSFFQEIGPMRLAPLGSPVLQRKAGYREVLRTWLRFRTAAELSWKGGEDVFKAGQRDVATLYEYWLFFVLLDWFCDRFNGGAKPPIEHLISGLDGSEPMLNINRKVGIGPFNGLHAGNHRRLAATFDYNRTFGGSRERSSPGSWTHPLRPDYTLTIWPEGMDQKSAEREELLVHIHFDAKYRAENVQALFGRPDVPIEVDEDRIVDEAEEQGTTPDLTTLAKHKRDDLIKMHAYRDAIRRSYGAYIIYPGSETKVFRGFHEILPGLGAFPVRPSEDGSAVGIEALTGFLEDVLEHLSNQMTARERVTYHVREAYRSGGSTGNTKESLGVREHDRLYNGFRGLHPDERHVLVAWYRNDAQLELARREDGLAYVRLGMRQGELHVHPNLSRVRHLLLRREAGGVAPGLLLLREPGFRIYTRQQLRRRLRELAPLGGVASWQASEGDTDEEFIYALFEVRPDSDFEHLTWDGDAVMDSIMRFEEDARNRPVGNPGRTSPYPRILPLSRVLGCLKEP